MQSTFATLGIRAGLVQALKRSGLAVPTPIQEAVIPLLLVGKDVIGQAQTGTGKTLAFLLPILELLKPEQESTQALVVTPTRELAIQITSEAMKLADAVGVKVLAAYGGQDVEGQIRKLKGSPHIVIGTPGRLLDHMRRGTLRLDRVSMMVIDEADQMLDMGFLPEVETIIAELPRDRQTMLFSATMPDSIRKLASQYMRKPENIQIAGKKVTIDGIKQLLVQTTDRAKLQTLIDMIERFNPFLAVIFCRTKIRAKKLTESLIMAGVNADELHGDLSQAKRELVMKRFREAKLQVLVATDVAARGLDVEGVTHVFNYDIPHDADSYIHRIGRTGRAGAKGMAITLAAPRDKMFVTQIERKLGKSIDVYVPDANHKQASGQGTGGERRDNRERTTKDRNKDRGKSFRGSGGRGAGSRGSSNRETGNRGSGAPRGGSSGPSSNSSEARSSFSSKKENRSSGKSFGAASNSGPRSGGKATGSATRKGNRSFSGKKTGR